MCESWCRGPLSSGCFFHCFCHRDGEIRFVRLCIEQVSYWLRHVQALNKKKCRKSTCNHLYSTSFRCNGTTTYVDSFCLSSAPKVSIAMQLPHSTFVLLRVSFIFRPKKVSAHERPALAHHSTTPPLRQQKSFFRINCHLKSRPSPKAFTNSVPPIHGPCLPLRKNVTFPTTTTNAARSREKYHGGTDLQLHVSPPGRIDPIPRLRKSFILSTLWTPQVYGPTS